MTTTSTRSARYGTGSIYYDSARRLWVGQVEMAPHADGRRRPKRVTAREKPAMLDKLRALQDQISRGEEAPAQGWTVRSWCEHYLAHLAPERSREDYRKTLRCWVWPYVGSRPIAKLQPEHVDRMLAALKTKGLADGTRALARRTLACALTEAMRRPSLGVRYNVAKLTKAPPSPKRHDPLTVEEAEQALAESEHDRLHALAVLALTAGLRQGECLALRWDAVNFRRRTVDVVHAKTAAGVRSIPMTPQLFDALKQHQAAQRTERMAAAEWADAGAVFTDEIGLPLSGSKCRRWWHGITEAAGLGKRRFHATRHTAATVMLNHGADLEVVSAILGHSSIAITADTYAKPNADKLRAGADAMAAALGSGA